MTSTTVAIGGDHAGYPYKDRIIELLEKAGYTVKDFGTDSEESVDYPDYVHPVADEVESGKSDWGIVLCGSGNGAAITVNKHQGIRAALCWTEELARLGREHNDANILSIPVRFVDIDVALAMVEAFRTASFDGGRHARRVGKIPVNC